MKTFALINLKGGSGKTTSVVSLAAAWAKSNQDVLVVDLDPQASLSEWLRAETHGAAGLLKGAISPSEAVEATKWNGIDVVGANRSLAALEDIRAGKLVRGMETLLRAAEDVYDYVLIDPPPSVGNLVITALLSADNTITPVQAAKGAVGGLEDTLGLIRRVGGAKLLGAFACRVDVRTSSDKQVPMLLKDELGNKAFDTYIRETVRVREAETADTPPPFHERCTAVEDYENLADEIASYE